MKTSHPGMLLKITVRGQPAQTDPDAVLFPLSPAFLGKVSVMIDVHQPFITPRFCGMGPSVLPCPHPLSDAPSSTDESSMRSNGKR